MDDLEAAKAFLLFLQSDALDEFRWDLDFRAAVQGSIAADPRGDHGPDAHVAYGVQVADEMARVRAERRKESKK